MSYKHYSDLFPGSFWRIRGEVSHRYLDFPYFEELVPTFFEDEIYLLVEIHEFDNWYHCKFLSKNDTLTREIPKGCWDNVFVLVQKSVRFKKEVQNE